MNVTVFITILFWGDIPPMNMDFLTTSTECSKELIQSYSKPLRVLDNWKAIKGECEVKEVYSYE